MVTFVRTDVLVCDKQEDCARPVFITPSFFIGEPQPAATEVCSLLCAKRAQQEEMSSIESLLSKHLVTFLGVLVALAALVANIGCAGVTAAPSSNSASSVSVQITPSSASLQPDSTQQFSATVIGSSSSSVTWSATGGTVSSTGLYTAPATPGNYVVQATSAADTSKSGSAAVTVLGSSTTPQISFSPAQLSFGTVTVNAATTQNLRIANVGAGTLTVSQLNFTGDNVFAVNGATFPLSIASGNSASVPIAFVPTASGSFTGSLTASSNANNSSSTVALSGTAASSASAHSVALNWNASTSSVMGYFVYRGTASGGPYSRLIATADPATTYTDTSVQSGATYYYVVTSVNGSGQESAFSNQASAVIPSP